MLVVVDYGSGNLRSVVQALETVAGEGLDVRISNDSEDVLAASHIILPGVGSFGDCVRGLRAVPGMVSALETAVLKKKKKFLGICVGMQMLFDEGHEHGRHKGLGWLEGEVALLKPTAPDIKVPHMGWNELHISVSHPLLHGIKNGDHAYFVHSYHARCRTGSDVIAYTDYGRAVTAVVARGNIMGTQFHPEKSQRTGLKILKNFVSL
ncbi:MAG: imidazole glycerol phosphate synthase subunit HisH [Alphaproteobacteria bacterium]